MRRIFLSAVAFALSVTLFISSFLLPVFANDDQTGELPDNGESESVLVGIDVSKYNGTIDWAKVKDDGVQFAMIRICARSGNTSDYVVDPMFEANVKGASEQGILIGAYFFSYAESVEAVVGSTSLPVTVKIRAGWDKASINAAEVARICEAAGATAICVHARTREEMYLPGVDVSIIGKVKEAVNIPVIGNGDIYTADDAINMIKRTGCDGVMVARGALGTPWLFSDIAARLEGKEYTQPTDAYRLREAKRLLSMMICDKGERIGTAEAKKQIAELAKRCKKLVIIALMKTY